MRNTPVVALLLIALVTFGACSTGTEGDSVIQNAEESDRPSQRVDRSEATPVERPRPGAYVYTLEGLGTTRIPAGTQLTETVSVSGDVYTVDVTNNLNENTQRVQLRWESKRVVQLLNQTNIGGLRRVCSYDPPLVVLHIPMFVEPFDDQHFTGTACEDTYKIGVIERTTVKDANGRSWAVWIIEVRSESPGRADVKTRWFSPGLGRDIRIETTTERNGTQDQTAQVLQSYPSPV